jgi:hypothetical protein
LLLKPQASALDPLSELALQLFGRFEVAAMLASRPVFRKAAYAMGSFDYWFIRHRAYSVQTGSSSLKVALAIFQLTIDRQRLCQILRISALISPNGVFRNGCSDGNFFKSIITSLFTRAFRVPPRSLVSPVRGQCSRAANRWRSRPPERANHYDKHSMQAAASCGVS